MKASELRIGNWIDEYGIPKQALPLDILGLYQIEQANKICIDLTPIPLTEEWFVKFGLTGQQAQNGLWYSTFYSNSAQLRVYWPNEKKKTVSIHCKPDVTEWYPELIGGIEFVHQLQNIIYCLTGTELTIK